MPLASAGLANSARTITYHQATSPASPKIVIGGLTIAAEPRDRIQLYTIIVTKPLMHILARALGRPRLAWLMTITSLDMTRVFGWLTLLLPTMAR